MTDYQDLLEKVQEKMKSLGDKPELLGQVIQEVLDRETDLVDLAMQQTLGWTRSELYGCTLLEVAYDLLDDELGQDYMRGRPHYTIYDDTFNFIMEDNDGHDLEYRSLDEAREEINGWFSQQDDTKSFSILDDDGNVVETIERDAAYEEDENDLGS